MTDFKRGQAKVIGPPILLCMKIIHHEQHPGFAAFLFGLGDRVILKDALKQLPLGYKRIFLLHDLLGYEHKEIAQALGCAIGTSKSQLHKARMRLRGIIKNGSSTNPLSAEPIVTA